jgi:hypothetical protein
VPVVVKVSLLALLLFIIGLMKLPEENAVILAGPAPVVVTVA